MKIAALNLRWSPSQPRRGARRLAGTLGRGLQPLEGRRLLAGLPSIVGPIPAAAVFAPGPIPQDLDGGASSDRGGIAGPTSADADGYGSTGPLAGPADNPSAHTLAGPIAWGATSTAAGPGPIGPDSIPLARSTASAAVPGPSPADRHGLAEATVLIGGTPTVELAVANNAAGRVSVIRGGAVVFTASGLGGSSAVKLADLNDDGTPDLIIADPTTDRVLVYAGLAGGGFSAEVGGGQGFRVGTDPVDLSVGRMAGSDRPDLIVANKGSNDVSILRFGGSGSAWTLASRTTVQAGIAPIKAMLVPPDDGSSTPNLLICNSGSADVYSYKTTATGAVATALPATIIGVDDPPSDMYAGHLGHRPETDLVTVSDDSDRATFVGGIFSAHPSRQDIATGIMHPVAALALPLGTGGAADLVIAGSDGRIALLQGTEDGVQLTDLTAPSGLTTTPIAAIATGDYADGGFDIYEASGDADSVAIIRFNLGDLAPVVATPGPDLATTIRAEDEASSVELLPSGVAPLEIVGILWDAPDDPPGAAQARSTARAGQALGTGGAASAAVLAASRSDEDELAGPAAEAVPWTRFVLGLDAAIESFQGDLAAIAAAEADDVGLGLDPFQDRRTGGPYLADSADSPDAGPPDGRRGRASTIAPEPPQADDPPPGPRPGRWRAEAARGASVADTPGLLTAVAGSGVAVRFLVNLSPPRPPRPASARRRGVAAGRPPVAAWPEVFPPTSPHG